MAASTERAVDSEALARRATVAGAVLLAVALGVVGGVSLLRGATPGFGTRLPTYALAGALGFVGALLSMRDSPRDPSAVLRRAAVAGVGGFGGLTLGMEGAVYALLVVAPDLSLYLVAAAVVGCGLAYWSYRSWHTVEDLTRPW
jgi:hypothetical protein